MRLTNNLKYQFILVYIFFCTSFLFAQQLEVVPSNIPPYSPEKLISNIFLGSGIDIIDIKFNGVPTSIGYFQKAATDLGIERGIFLTTGLADQVTEHQSLETSSPSSLLDHTDNELLGLLPATPAPTLVDIASFEITFIPTSDTLKFDYIFASDEYPEWTCTKFNDVFGFFISGPNPSGGNYSNQNIALVPGTNTPVAINNVNNGNPISPCVPSHPEFYNDNTGNANFVYDGYTDLFTAIAAVTPCESYTIKIAISDVNDEARDSGVFLKAKSFGTGGVSIEALTATTDKTIVEGCSDAEMVFELPFNVASDVTIAYQFVGTAQNGIDVDMLPTEVVIPQGQSSFRIPVHAIEDGINEPIEMLGFDVAINSCKRDTFWVNIRDFVLDESNLVDTISICHDETTILDGTLSTPFREDIVFSNTNNVVVLPELEAIFSDIIVSGIVPQILHPDMIKSICIDSLSHDNIEDLDIFLIGPNGQFVELTTDNGEDGGNGLGKDYYLQTCFVPTALQPIDRNIPTGAPAGDVPFTGDFLPEGYFSDLWDGKFDANGTWRLQLFDDTNSSLGTIHSWSISFNDEYQYEYHWTPDPTLSCLDCPNPVASPSENTTYYFNVNDTYGCTYSDSVVVMVDFDLPDFSLSCTQMTDTQVTIGWFAPRDNIVQEINIDGQGWIVVTGDSYIITGLSPDQTVNVTIRFSNSCSIKSSSLSCTTSSSACPEITISETEKTHPSCPNNMDGSIQISIAEPGTYSYTLGASFNNTGFFDDLDAGTYTIMIEDQDNCQYEYTFTLDKPIVLEPIPALSQSISCNGASDAICSFSVLNGASPYNYLWSTGETSSEIQNVSPGLKTVTITDVNGCEGTGAIEIIEPDLLEIDIDVTHISCSGSTGSAEAIVTGGTGPYDYLWDNTVSTANNPNLAVGNISITVTDANSCEQIATEEITQLEEMMASSTTEDASCSTTPDGQATIIINSGGVAPFSYNWSNSASTSASAMNLNFGPFMVTITDANNCTLILNDTIHTPNPLLFTSEVDHITCHGDDNGNITITPEGGTPNYTILWDSGPTEQTINGLTVGDYTFTITDQNGCTQSDIIVLNEPDSIHIQTLNTTYECNDPSSGIIEVSATGGTGDLFFEWENGDTTSIIFNVNAGVHTVTVTDDNTCRVSKAINLQSANPMAILSDKNDILCYGDSTGIATISVFGGNSPFDILWDNGIQNDSLENLPAGTYYMTITDAEGCKINDSVEIMGPSLLLPNDKIYQPVCNLDRNGSIVLDPEGGTKPYLFSFNKESFSSNLVISQLQSGIYTCDIKDANNCLTELEFEIINPPPIELEIQSDDEIQYGETTHLMTNIQYAIGDIRYQWLVDSSIVISCLDCSFPEVSPLVTTTYHLLVRDENGCTKEDYFTVHVILDTEVYVPSAITPNGDGVNDNFNIYFGNPEAVQSIDQLTVADNWGEILYRETDVTINDIDSGWDGIFRNETVQAGVYMYVLEVTFINGEQKLLKGGFTVIR